MRSLLLALLLLFVPATVYGQTLTIRDIVALTKAGLGEEVLIALVEVHRAVFPVDVDTLKMLKDAGVSQKVIAAMVKSGREMPPVIRAAQPEPEVNRPAPAPAPAPQVVVIDHQSDEPRLREVRDYPVSVAYPVYVPVRAHRQRLVDPPRHVEPVYWGFGGKLRPDAWRPSRESLHKPFGFVEAPQKK